MPLEISKFSIFIADLGETLGTEPGKIRPVVVIQTDLLNDAHPSTIVCPLTTNILPKGQPIRVRVSPSRSSGLRQDSEVMVDQIRTIDNRRFLRRIGRLTRGQKERLARAVHLLVCE
ncbi:MAG: type II toxin-antitoxin system PemK/MazF family toxin [Elusimicrobia bacterium]|nr:type II toxin-antitoxin system PemK/MazF family toxin [Elusimicrobiota bacterium]